MRRRANQYTATAIARRAECGVWQTRTDALPRGGRERIEEGSERRGAGALIKDSGALQRITDRVEGHVDDGRDRGVVGGRVASLESHALAHVLEHVDQHASGLAGVLVAEGARRKAGEQRVEVFALGSGRLLYESSKEGGLGGLLARLALV